MNKNEIKIIKNGKKLILYTYTSKKKGVTELIGSELI